MLKDKSSEFLFSKGCSLCKSENQKNQDSIMLIKRTKIKRIRIEVKSDLGFLGGLLFLLNLSEFCFQIRNESDNGISG